MPESPEGYQPYREPGFPPKIINHLANGVMALLTVFALLFYQADSAAFIIGLLFGGASSHFLHESIHYVSLSRLGYQPTFKWPDAVWAPNVGLPVREGVISLISPQVLTIAFSGMLLISEVDEISFMIVIALVYNLVGGLRDITWATRRLLWPKGHLVLVDSEGNEFVSFPE